ncbi:COP9 signalosome, subunit CSN8 [Carex rostrata]
MDLSQLHDALSSQSFDKIADICDELILQVASTGVAYHEEWPYTIHLLGHLYIHDLNSARFLWKSVPQGIKETRPELVAAWKIGQCLWTKDYAGVYNAVRGFDWSPEASGIIASFLENYTRKMFDLLTFAYSTITVSDAAHFMGMSEEDATKYAVEHGWSLDAPTKMLTAVKPKIATEQKADPSKLQRLTEFVFHLEN